MRKKSSDDEPMKTDRWLTTYSDMMNNLLVLFMVLYAMSVLNLEKFKALAQSFSEASGTTSQITQTMQVEGQATTSSDIDSKKTTSSKSNVKDDKFDEIYKKIQKKIKENGYSNSIILEKGDNFIKFRFKDSVLFYPDSPVMKNSSDGILKYMGDLLKYVNTDIQTIEIAGHTADINRPENIVAWQLSSDRAIAVLQFLANKCNLPQSKMTVSGYSHFHPVASNDTEEGKSMNRRVEVKIIRVVN